MLRKADFLVCKGAGLESGWLRGQTSTVCTTVPAVGGRDCAVADSADYNRQPRMCLAGTPSTFPTRG